MWILPRQLHTSVSALGMEALISDSSEQSQACARWLLVRSKLLPVRTWCLKWNRDSWTRHLSGRILRPSHTQSFVTAWTSSLGVTHASPSLPPAGAVASATPVTSGRSLQMEFPLCDPSCASLRTSKDISAWGCPTSSKTWQDWVTERRGAYSRRLKSERLTQGSGCSSWPTATTTDACTMGPEPRPSRIRTNRSTEYLARMVHWPTANARDWKDSGCSQGMRTTPNLGTAVHRNGQAAQENNRMDGNRRGSLNPRWVETLMGLPVGWTMPSCASPVTIGQTS